MRALAQEYWLKVLIKGGLPLCPVPSINTDYFFNFKNLYPDALIKMT